MNLRLAGAVLVVVGFILLAVGGIPYKKSTNVAEIGGLKMSVREEKQFSVPSVISGIVIALGVAMLIGARKKPSA
jgi:hypothetical protein